MARPERQTPRGKTPEQGLERKSETSAPLRGGGYGPFSLMRQLSEDFDRFFGGFFGPGLFQSAHFPEIEIQHAGNKLVIQADVPGLKKEDLSIEVKDNGLIISGERRSKSESTEGGYYRTERSYGSFSRTVPLPKDAKPDTASATFEDGVLKIEMEAPVDEQAHGRRIEVRKGRAH